MMWVERAWIPSMGSWQTLERSSFQECQKCSSDLIAVSIASRASQGILQLWGNGAIINEGLESLLVFTLRHHFKLLPASVVAISFLGNDVEGFQVIYSPGIEDFPVLQLVGGN